MWDSWAPLISISTKQQVHYTCNCSLDIVAINKVYFQRNYIITIKAKLPTIQQKEKKKEGWVGGFIHTFQCRWSQYMSQYIIKYNA